MDDFKRFRRKTIGFGGIKCPCCNIYRTFGNHGKQKPGLNKLIRSRLKNDLREIIKEEGKIFVHKK